MELTYFSGPYSNSPFSLQLPRQILLGDELGRVKRTGFLPIIFSAYLVDLSVDTTVLWQFKHCNIRTSWNRLRVFIKDIWKPHVKDVGEPVQIKMWVQTFTILCLTQKSEELDCRTVHILVLGPFHPFECRRRGGAWGWNYLCYEACEWQKQVGGIYSILLVRGAVQTYRS